MTTRENMNQLGLVQTLGPATFAADASGAAVDMKGFESATVVFAVGIGGITFDANNRIDLKIEKSDDDIAWTGVTQDEVYASEGTTVTVGTDGIVRSLTSAHAAADANPFKIAVVTDAEYIRTLADFSGTHATGTPLSAHAILGHAALKPVA